jgi:hypothetical protein
MVQTPSVPPVEKLPLAARKNIRDEFDSKIAEYTKTVSELLKVPYKLEVNFNQFYAHGAASEDSSSWVKSSPGSAAASYFESFIYYLKTFTDNGEYTDAIEAFNDLVTEKRVAIEAGGEDISYSDCSVKDGTFEINYDPKRPGTNCDYACREMPKRFDEALFARSPDTLPMIAKRSIREDYDSAKASILKSTKEELLGADITFVADYDAIWKTIVAGKKVDKSLVPQDKAGNFGGAIKGYFEGFVWQLKNNFKQDDMMVEGFTEAVTTSQVRLEVAPQGTALKDTYSEIQIVDGVFVLRTVPSYFGTNVDYVARGIVDLL